MTDTLITLRARLTVPQLSEVWQCDRHTVDRHIRSGALKAINVGHGSKRPRWLIPIEAIEEFEAARTNSLTPTATRRRDKLPKDFARFFKPAKGV